MNAIEPGVSWLDLAGLRCRAQEMWTAWKGIQSRAEFARETHLSGKTTQLSSYTI